MLCFVAPSAGSNGHEFMFLLKGHEDLRQDERVMQLFGLVNTLLANDPASLRKNLRYTHSHTISCSIPFRPLDACWKSPKFVCAALTSIQRYAVIPLSTNSGLIGWVPHCDTLHALIRDYREKKKILLNIEHRIMLRVKSRHLSHNFYTAEQLSSASALVYSLASVRLTYNIEVLWKMLS